jgi:uncharacterized membrane protein (UPF0182 family)
MRAPRDLSSVRVPRRPRRLRVWLVVLAVILIVLIASLKSIVTLWTDSLWFSSIDQHRVWSTLIGVKVGLFVGFGAVFFVGLWANLIACDRLAGVPAEDAEDELVRRYQRAIRPYAGRVYAAIALVLALIAASGTIGEWQNWILFRNSTSFGVTDPQFHRDVSYYVFKLPFETFVVNWVLVSLIVMLVVTAIFHYLNGGIRAQRVSPRVRPAVKAHLSLLLALIALAKAAGYYLQRYNLLNGQDGYVNGAGYTDVHARLPAYGLLILVSIAVAGLLLYNIWRQGWLWPVIAVGVWAFVALVVGVIYPAVLQALRVTPAQSTLELPYIHRNIQATRAAYLLNDIGQQQVTGKLSPSAESLNALQPTLNNMRLWDPDPSITQLTFQRQQNQRSYYTFQSVAIDRYTVHDKVTPAIIGVRQLDPTGIPSPSWVNTHLQYTHGEGVALAPANQTSTVGTGQSSPNYTIRDVPPTSAKGYPVLRQPDVYFGLNNPGYVVVNTKQAELDYPSTTGGATVNTHYASTGGVRIGNWFTKAAFALRLGDFNLLVSSQVTDHSRIMFVRDVMAMAQKAAPFLSYDHDPYAAVVNGHIDWILNAYTTSAGYPYSQNANSQLLPPGSGLPSSLNYVRNSVVVVVDSYTGKITFYDIDPHDPVLEAYSKAFPGLFTTTAMPQDLQAHMRYPEDIFSVQAALYGRYHLTQPQAFYTSANAWSVSPTSGVSQNLTYSTQTVGGVTVTGPPIPMSPLYQVLHEPGTSGEDQRLTELDAYVPFQPYSQSTNFTAQNLTGFLIADSDPGKYGRLNVYKEPTNLVVQGPAQAEAKMSQNQQVSQNFTLLDQHGTYAVLGNILVVPLGQSVLYVRPMYVSSRSNPQPQLNSVIVEYNGAVGYASTLQAALVAVLGPNVPNLSGSSPPSTPTTPTTPTTPGSPSSSQVQTDIANALNAYNAAQAALKNGDFATYGSEIAAMHQALQAAQQALAASTPAAPSATTTTTTAPKGTTTTTSGTGHAAGSGTTAKAASARRSPSTTTTKPGET